MPVSGLLAPNNSSSLVNWSIAKRIYGVSSTPGVGGLSSESAALRATTPSDDNGFLLMVWASPKWTPGGRWTGLVEES